MLRYGIFSRDRLISSLCFFQGALSMDPQTLQNSITTAYNEIFTLVTAYGLSVLGAVVTLVIGWIAARWARAMVDKALSKVKAVDVTLRHFVASLVRYAILVLVVVMVLEKFGVQTASLVAVVGAAGLAIGLALQGTLQNVAAGVMLLAFRPFQVGDYIEAGGQAGTVKSLSLFVTEMATPDNVMVIVPNSELWNKAIKNYSANPTRRLDLVVGISYSDDIDHALAALTDLASKDPRVLPDPAVQTMVSNLGESSVDLTLRLWINADDYWAVKWDLTKALKQRMDAEGISIPFPQRDLHVIAGNAIAANNG
jgi:small conductance mechanosensitive channel